MPERLLFADAAAAADAQTFAGRASTVADGEVRLRAAGGVLVMTAAALAPRGLFDATPTVLTMRTLAVDPELVCDVVIVASALTSADDDASALLLPDTAVSPAWAGVSPPQGQWSQTGELPASVLAARAQWGITTVAEALPANPGEDIVRTVRGEVWGSHDPALGDLPLGVAFAAFTMGFIAGEETARVLSSGAWTRVTLSRGHVLVRGPVRIGMTPVRTTGTPER